MNGFSGSEVEYARGDKEIFGSERTIELFLRQISSPPPPTPAPTSRGRADFIFPWPLTVYLNSTRKGCITGDRLRKQRRPRISQSVNAGRRWSGKYWFASRGEQIGTDHRRVPNTITFLNIPGITLSDKMHPVFH